MTDTEYTAQLAKLTRQLRKGATNLSRRDLRYLVNVYEEVQKHRIRAGQQVKAAEREGNEPNFVIVWMHQTFAKFEESVKKILDEYTSADPVGRWIRSIPGLGPYIAAGLLALIEIEKAPTVGHIWRFAGLDPTLKWSPGQKRPFNARLKRICYFIGQAFVLYKKKGSLYSRIYEERKRIETEKNERGEYKEQAAIGLKRVRETTEAYRWYAQGKLPPAHIDMRARRYAVKVFLAHLHEIMYQAKYGRKPPRPFVLERVGNLDDIEIPNLELVTSQSK